MPLNWRSLLAMTRKMVKATGGFTGVDVYPKDDETHVDVKYDFPYPPGPGTHRYLLSTINRPLDRPGFPNIKLRDNIAADAQKPRHRALFFWDKKQRLTLAALSFHVDEKSTVPLVICDIAIRKDELQAHSMFAFYMLLDLLMEVAKQDRDGERQRKHDEVGALAQNATEKTRLEKLGLTLGEKPKMLKKNGDWYRYPTHR